MHTLMITPFSKLRLAGATHSDSRTQMMTYWICRHFELYQCTICVQTGSGMRPNNPQSISPVALAYLGAKAPTTNARR